MKPRAPLPADTVHVVVDMQRLFAGPGAWAVPRFGAILPAIAALAAARPQRTLFTRFVVPPTADVAAGHWRDYYRRWPEFTADRLPGGALDLAPELAALARPDNVIAKRTYSAFGSTAFCDRLCALDAGAVVLTGVETDSCVLASVLAAVDRGLRVVVVADALASGSDAAHAAILAHVFPRLDAQIEILVAADILSGWS